MFSCTYCLSSRCKSVDLLASIIIYYLQFCSTLNKKNILLLAMRSRRNHNERNVLGFCGRSEVGVRARIHESSYLYYTSKIPVRWPGQCYGFTLSCTIP